MSPTARARVAASYMSRLLARAVGSPCEAWPVGVHRAVEHQPPAEVLSRRGDRRGLEVGEAHEPRKSCQMMLPGRASPQQSPTRLVGSGRCAWSQANGARRAAGASRPVELAARRTPARASSCVAVPGRRAGRDQPVEPGGAPVDRVERGEHREAVVDQPARSSGAASTKKPSTRCSGGLSIGTSPVDEPHHEERRAEHRRVGLVADERRERDRRCGGERVHDAVLDLDLDVEPLRTLYGSSPRRHGASSASGSASKSRIVPLLRRATRICVGCMV